MDIPKKGLTPCRTVAIIEDDDAIRSVVAEILASEGYQVISLTLLNKQATQPCLVLLDVMMPVMDGAGFLAARKEHPNLTSVPVVIFSAAGVGSLI